ncbi:tRNA 2-thiocytidine(32) synthetase TtcA [Helicobacter didelphidarum]|uniref:tRNA 2-thiocytidine(32) synthetase TtcA n=1 Tax=Helicobacter didelphidarum TaxID=2040648 RepID=A0A3D8INT2_9HELI|nr:ATP-binding protein [Helicobacter didelphidarum]RDU66773.1 tRNA 2-thiocytidine(32) synthetase TtcA [Helicobacter didelphidarum]
MYNNIQQKTSFNMHDLSQQEIGDIHKDLDITHSTRINLNNKPQISKKILNLVGRTNAKYNLIGENDKILLGLSGGKDSMLLATIFAHMQRHAPFKFDFLAMTIDYGRGGEYEYIFEYCNKLGIPYELNRTEIFKILENHKKEGSIYCSFCSRMRRGELYNIALKRGFNKIALAHHLDDAAESFMMNLTYNGSLRSMPPYYKAKNGLGVIRPLIFVRERQIIDFIASNHIYIAPDCNCPINWLPQDKRPRARAETKELLRELESKNPLLFKSLKNAFSNLHVNSFCDERFMDIR